ncbi:porin family protein [Chromatocurvus halotolerans]|uniref:Opacity protein-like surface antigen n=1 Tax=Chromatocurvus halotolerans TaxID=1132028 RepID=A0A4R2L032_9GAMM|nr:porin family protein [Chromatocurvus halotolerans]TCO75888.1 opacity protein-like surface antigen [Chromatocurvus halotolerans]
MRSSVITMTLLVLPFVAPGLPSASAQDKPWSAALHVGVAEVSRRVTDSGPWWNDVDDDATALGVSLGYDVLPMLGVRVMYEEADNLRGVNTCPADAICPAVVIREEVGLRSWHAALLPRYEFAPDWTVFGTLGAQRWKLDRDDVLPDDSGTAFTYGAGVTWQFLPRLDVGLEYQSSQVDYDAVRLSLGYRF